MAVDLVVRNFSLNRTSRALKAVFEFISAWEEKPITKTGEIGELLDYLEYFREAGGGIPLASNDENAVRLMTAHAAKGLEFAHVFILRASSPSFPSPYKEPLLEFPRELHDPASIAQDDDKELCKQEERRLVLRRHDPGEGFAHHLCQTGFRQRPQPSRLPARSSERLEPAGTLAGTRPAPRLSDRYVC